MALIKLESRFTQVEPASYHAPSLEKSKVLVVGYPGENTTQVRGSCPLCKRAGCMYEVTGQAEYNAENLLEYRLSTMPGTGNSGSPVFLDSIPKEHARRTVIATHSCGNSDSGINYAAPVDVAFIEACKAFLIQTERQRSQAKVIEQNSSSEEDEVEEGFVVLPSEPSHDVPSAQNYTGPWKWLRKRR
ncbi:hypothetical protein J4E91_000263 [Alternaria rosae]|nr:hypothetical protein J4E91_000263 [Alternaria rosae]